VSLLAETLARAADSAAAAGSALPAKLRVGSRSLPLSTSMRKLSLEIPPRRSLRPKLLVK